MKKTIIAIASILCLASCTKERLDCYHCEIRQGVYPNGWAGPRSYYKDTCGLTATQMMRWQAANTYEKYIEGATYWQTVNCR